MAGLVPAAGSSYSYTYATMGEGMAWICGWCLVLEYAVSVAAVAVGAASTSTKPWRSFGLEPAGRRLAAAGSRRRGQRPRDR